MKRAGVFGCCVLALLSLLWSGAQAEVCLLYTSDAADE